MKSFGQAEFIRLVFFSSLSFLKVKRTNSPFHFYRYIYLLQELVFVPLIFFFFSLESITLVRSKMILSQRLAKRFELIAALFLLRYAISIYGLYNKEYGLPLQYPLIESLITLSGLQLNRIQSGVYNFSSIMNLQFIIINALTFLRAT